MAKFCYQCSSELSENMVFCPHCGTRIIIFKSPQFINSSQEQLYEASPTYSDSSLPNDSTLPVVCTKTNPNTKKHKYLKLFIILITFIMIFGSVILLFMYRNGDIMGYHAYEPFHVVFLLTSSLEKGDAKYVKGLLPTYSEETNEGKKQATEQKKYVRQNINRDFEANSIFIQLMAGKEYLFDYTINSTIENRLNDYPEYRTLYSDLKDVATIEFDLRIYNSDGKLVHTKECSLTIIKQGDSWKVSNYKELSVY